MIGMNAITGRALSGIDHLTQSVTKILTTPLYSRVARREFGAELADLVDAPNNPATRVRLYSAVATALMRYEPRLRLVRVSLSTSADDAGKTVIDIEGTTDISRDAVSMRVTLNTGT